MGFSRSKERSIELSWYSGLQEPLRGEFNRYMDKLELELEKLNTENPDPDRERVSSYVKSYRPLVSDHDRIEINHTHKRIMSNRDIMDERLNQADAQWIEEKGALIKESIKLLKGKHKRINPDEIINKGRDLITKAQKTLEEIINIKKLHDFFQAERARISCLSSIVNIGYQTIMNPKDRAFMNAYMVKVYNAINAAERLDLHDVLRRNTHPMKVNEALTKKLNSPLFHYYLTLLKEIESDTDKLSNMSIVTTPEQKKLIDELKVIDNEYVSEYIDKLKSTAPTFIQELKSFFDNFEGTNSDGIKTIRATINKYATSNDPLQAFSEITKVMQEQGEKLSKIKRHTNKFLGMKGRAPGVQIVYNYLSENGISSIEDINKLKEKLSGQVLVHGKTSYDNDGPEGHATKP